MEDKNKDTSYIEVYRTHEATKVALIESLLSSERIPMQVDRKTLNQVFGGVFGIVVMVPSADAERAVRVLRTAGYLPEEDATAPESVVLRGRGAKPISVSKSLMTVILFLFFALMLMAAHTYLLSR